MEPLFLAGITEKQNGNLKNANVEGSCCCLGVSFFPVISDITRNS